MSETESPEGLLWEKDARTALYERLLREKDARIADLTAALDHERSQNRRLAEALAQTRETPSPAPPEARGSAPARPVIQAGHVPGKRPVDGKDDAWERLKWWFFNA